MRKRTIAAITVAGGITAILAAAIIAGPPPPSGNAGAAAAHAARTPLPVLTPAPVPSPDGTYAGSCDYILGSDPVGGFGPGTAYVIAEVDLTNTGNVGTVSRVHVTWPQEGAAPIAAHKTARVAAGATRPVRFKVHITGDQVNLLQSWQDRHGFADGCQYKATIVRQYGPVSS